jgi:hypothetical protein
LNGTRPEFVLYMARYKKALIDAFKPHFKEHGFTKKDATWYLLTEETIHVFNIQTSQWGEIYYFNAGVYFRALGGLVTPAIHLCHIQTRIPDQEFHVARVAHADELSNFEGGQFESEGRILELKNLVYPLALNWFERFQNIACAKRELSAINRPSFPVTKTVWPLLGLEMPQ